MDKETRINIQVLLILDEIAKKLFNKEFRACTSDEMSRASACIDERILRKELGAL